MKCQDSQGCVTLGSGRPGWIRAGPDHSCQGLTMGRTAGVRGGRPLPLGLAEGPRTAAPASALISVGFWLTGVLSQSPHFRSYSNLVTSLTPQKGGASSPVLMCGHLGSFLFPSLFCVPLATWGRTQRAREPSPGAKRPGSPAGWSGVWAEGGPGPSSTPSPQGRDLCSTGVHSEPLRVLLPKPCDL